MSRLIRFLERDTGCSMDKFGRAERSIWKHLRMISTDITHVSPLRQEIARGSLIGFRRIFDIEMCHPS